MPTFRACVFLALPLGILSALAGCGNQISPASAVTVANATGDWRFWDSGSNVSVAAGLVDKAGTVTGTGTVYGCAPSPEQTTLSGSVDHEGSLTLKTVQLPGGTVLTVQGHLGAAGNTAGDATLIASGGGCGGPATRHVNAEEYAPASGNYTGSFVGADGSATPVSATLSQSSNPGPGGGYTLSGAVSFPSSPCLATAAIADASSDVLGGNLSATYNATVGGQAVTITATGTADVSASNITITRWTIAGGPCDGYSGTGMLSQ